MMTPTSCYCNCSNRLHRRRTDTGHRIPQLALLVGGVRRMNEVNARRARLVLGWVTVFGRVYYLGM